jgi:hypothetical protein
MLTCVNYVDRREKLLGALSPSELGVGLAGVAAAETVPKIDENTSSTTLVVVPFVGCLPAARF